MTMDISLARGLFSKASDDLEEFIDTVKAFRRQVLVIYTVARRDYGVKVEIVVKSRHPVTTTLTYQMVRIRSQLQYLTLSTILDNTYSFISDYANLLELNIDSE